jgi:hypothetical protein
VRSAPDHETKKNHHGPPAEDFEDGQIPASFTAGAGKIVTGAAADKAKAAAMAAYPGGTVTRVVLLLFVNASFTVVGAE